MADSPSPNGQQTGDGRDNRGRFAPGCRGGPGNPNAARVNKYRRRLWKCVKSSDIEAAVKVLREVMANAKPADRLAAAREILDRTVGKAVQSDLLERIEKLELAQQERQATP